MTSKYGFGTFSPTHWPQGSGRRLLGRKFHKDSWTRPGELLGCWAHTCAKRTAPPVPWGQKSPGSGAFGPRPVYLFTGRSSGSLTRSCRLKWWMCIKELSRATLANSPYPKRRPWNLGLGARVVRGTGGSLGSELASEGRADCGTGPFTRGAWGYLHPGRQRENSLLRGARKNTRRVEPLKLPYPEWKQNKGSFIETKTEDLAPKERTKEMDQL